jgi:hypothetical protein
MNEGAQVGSDGNWRKRFPEAQLILTAEGGAVYGAEAEGAWWLITDEGSLADLLDEEEQDVLVGVTRFDDRGEWRRAIARKVGFLVGARLTFQLSGLMFDMARRLALLAKERDLERINERDHMQACAQSSLAERAPSLLEGCASSSQRKVRFPEWPRLGNVDLTLDPPDPMPPVFFELKCGAGEDALGPCAWDLLKLAFLTRKGEATAGFLIAATTAEAWELPARGAEFFGDGNWEASELRELYGDWWRQFERDGYPAGTRVPAHISTQAVAAERFHVGATAWELRASWVRHLGDDLIEWELVRRDG